MPRVRRLHQILAGIATRRAPLAAELRAPVCQREMINIALTRCAKASVGVGRAARIAGGDPLEYCGREGAGGEDRGLVVASGGGR